MGQLISFNPDDVLNCYGIILDYTLGVYSYASSGSVEMGITNQYGEFSSDSTNYSSLSIGLNNNYYQFSAKIFLEKEYIGARGGSEFDFDVKFGSRVGAPNVVTHYHYFCCKGKSNTPSENAPINANIYFLM